MVFRWQQAEKSVWELKTAKYLRKSNTEKAIITFIVMKFSITFERD